jgi:hypothetical protein
MALVEEAYVNPACSVATFDGSVVILLVRTALTLEGLHSSIASARRIALRRGRGAAGLTIVQGGVSIPGPELRQAMNESIKDSRTHSVCSAQVLIGTGFWLSTMRSVLTALELIRPGDLPRRTFEDVAPAARWVAGHLERDAAWAERLTLAARSVMDPVSALGSSSA